MQLRKYKQKLSRLEHIFISHLHGDHSLGLVGLISTLNLLGRKNDLFIHAHGPLEEILRKNIDFFVNDLQFTVHFVHLESKKHKVIYSDKNISVESLPLKHRIPSTGFLFRETQKEPNIKKEYVEKYEIPLAEIVKIKQGANFVTAEGVTIPNSELTYISSFPRSYAYCSDTSYSEKLVELLKNVDLLYHEATFDSSMTKMAKATGHSTALQAATIAAKAQVGKLIIGHFSSRYKEIGVLLAEARSVFPETYLAEEGEQHIIEEKRLNRQ